MNPRDERRTAQALASEIKDLARKHSGQMRFMEVCGTHTMAIHAAGLKSLFPESVKLVSGPGCPVCVTEKRFIDHAILLAAKYDACVTTFGDLVRVPGSSGSLTTFRSEGGTVRVVYSPLDAVEVAVAQSPRPTVFLGVGFETTIPTVAATLKAALARGVENFYVLPAFKTIHPPLRILAAKDDLHGFLLPGHVSAIIGSDCFSYLVDDFHKPGVIGGFEPLDILLALRDLVSMTVRGTSAIVNDYKRVVRADGNRAARDILYDVFEPADASWRGLGVIPGSGLAFKGPYTRFDAAAHFPVNVPESKDDPRCLCAAILTGSKTPDRCGLFGKECTPEDPVGPCMVSSEGTCAAYYKYGAV
ncbi:MAG: hydrogenase formation protein HypD [Desulfomonile tiedjei]|uniref:Hydrogenase formation protein HypD n=1 Tax=Desulfomonile tiedjei TaxID=2358 RepID=A0A9D6Z5Z9_9BACT|nr:hydrogenase formation protein HypD [Desulfomonile tiedjei]